MGKLKQRPALVFWLCESCGHYLGEEPPYCPYCGRAWTWNRFTRIGGGWMRGLYSSERTPHEKFEHRMGRETHRARFEYPPRSRRVPIGKRRQRRRPSRPR